MNKEKLTAFAKHGGTLVLSIGAALAAFAAGIYTADGGAWDIACFVIGFAIVALACANVIANTVAAKRMRGMRAKQAHDYAERIKSEIESDYASAEKKVRTTIAVAYSYAAFVIVLLLLFCFSLGRLGDDAGFAPFIVQFVLVCAASVLMWGVVYMFVAVDPSAPPETRVVLDENEYPRFYAVARNAASAAGCGDRAVVLYDMTDGISVTGCGNTIYINLDYAEAAVLTRDELFNVMLHEFAHVVYDFGRGRVFRRAMSRTSCEDRTNNPFVKIAEFLFLSYAGYRVQKEVLFFDTVSSRSFEQRADEMIGRAGNKRTYADACAKIDGFFQFAAMNCREMQYDFYAPETPTKGFASRYVETYYAYREKYGEVWKERMLCELPARVDSHPTTRMRLEALGANEFATDAKETDEAYLAEIKKLLESRDEMVYKRMTEEEGYYENYRKNAYVTRKAVMDGYIAAEEAGDVSEPKMLVAVRAFKGIDDDKALEIIDKALAKNAAAPRANFIKGAILFERRDPACVDCFKLAAKLPKLADSAYEKIGEFALKTGDEELLAEYRADVCDVVQNADDAMERTALGAHTELVPHDLDDKTVKELAADLTARCDGIGKIHVGKYVDVDGGAHYLVYVVADTNKITTYDGFVGMMSRSNDLLELYSDEHDFVSLTNCYSDKHAAALVGLENSKIFDSEASETSTETPNVDNT